MGKKPKGRSRKKKKFPVMAAVMAVAAAAAVTAAGIGTWYYIYRGKQYETVFFPSTKINGIDASDKTVEQMEKLISETADEYVLTIRKLDGGTEQITGKEIGMHSVFDGKLEEYLADQEPMEWWIQKDKEKDYETEAVIAFDEEKLEQRIFSLQMLNQENTQRPKDAYLSEYLPGQGYVVIPDEPGTALDREKTAEKIRTAVKTLKTELELSELDVYEKAAVTSEDKALNELADRLNRFVNMTVTYVFGESQEVLDGEVISQWLRLGEGGEVSVDQEAVTAYVKGLADKYNTASKKKILKTSYGAAVEIGRGTYGWRIDQAAETEQLYQILLSGESQVREPAYRQKAASHGENDYGDTYVEINLTAQHLFFYKNGQLIVESDFVSGNSARGYDTPSGVYPLTYKQRNATLRGADYATPVSYWMPFNGNIGMHDATWRGAFGGSIYKTNGSHGCINLPRDAARTIFENIEKGMPVLCYHLGGTESGGTSPGGEAAGMAQPADTGNTQAGAETGSVPETEAAVNVGAGESADEPETSQNGMEEETERYKMPWEYGPGMTEAETAAENRESQPGASSETAASGDGEQSQPGPQPDASALESQEAGPGMPGAGNEETREVGPGMPEAGNEETREVGPGMQND